MGLRGRVGEGVCGLERLEWVQRSFLWTEGVDVGDFA